MKGRNDLLPAEGTIFITNYRVIFHGISKEYDDRKGNILFFNFKGRVLPISHDGPYPEAFMV